MLRTASLSDAAAILDIYAPNILDNAVSFELELPSLQDIQNRIQYILPVTPWLVYQAENGQVAGYAYASSHRDRPAYQWTREVSVYVHPDYWRHGVARRLYAALIEIVSMQGYANLLAGITQPNTASVRFHESFGFRLVGIYHQIGFKMGAYHDVGWWELPLAGSSQAPKTIIPFSELEHTEAVAQILKNN